MNRYEALKHAVRAHAGQVDKCGQPYILHPIAVSEAIERGDYPNEDTLVVALLHDVLEDTDYELYGLGDRQRLALNLLTRAPLQSYDHYLVNICTEPYRDVWQIACLVKLADLWHNLSPERQSCLPSKEAASLEKRYLKARARIWEALGYEWWPQQDGGEQ